MAEYIERELAIEALSRGDGCGNVCRRAIERILAADVAPVRHGRWVEQDKYTFGVFYDCSICGNRILDNGHSWNYCPNCGADMRGSNDEGVTVREWISVDDRLPEEKVNCIVHYKHAYCDNDDYWAIGMCFYDGEKFQLAPAYKVTHWMPLPERPKGE